MRWLGISASSSFEPANSFLREHRFLAVVNGVNFNARKIRQQEYNGKPVCKASYSEHQYSCTHLCGSIGVNSATSNSGLSS